MIKSLKNINISYHVVGDDDVIGYHGIQGSWQGLISN